MIEVVDKFNMVDMGGIDIVESQGVTVEGLFNKLLTAIQNCKYRVLYNWKFAQIEIAPSYVELVFDGENVIINDAITVTEDSVVHIHSLEPEPIVPLIEPLTVTENGVYEPPTGVDGFNPVSVSISGNAFFPSYDTGSFVSSIAEKYSGGYEYKSYIYGTQILDTNNAVLLADASQGADSVELSEPLSNFNGIILQGVYRTQRTSSFNTTIMYLSPSISTQYWAGMKDRNQSYSCFVTFSDDSTALLSGNKQVIIYGVP